MPDVTANLNLNVPFPGENVGDWHLLANPNWRAIDAAFAPLPSTSPGGTGHVHNGVAGQGPKISHDNLTDAGTKSHPQIEVDLTDIFSRITNIEGTYCADVTCGAGGGSGGGIDPHPPVHYTENFTTEQGTRLAAMDWLVNSDSGLSDVQASGHSGYLSTLMGYPFTDRYAAVVKCQIPHMECQRVTYHITRLTADGLVDGDSVMMVMALMSTHLLGASTPYIHLCGIKMVIILSKQGGTYSVTRMAIAQVNDTETHLLRQDHNEGLSFNDAEQFFRGCHEFSVDNTGALWYYHKRAPIWILPAGTCTLYFPQITATLLGVQEPPFGSIGFGWAWNIVESAFFDVEMAWLTIDSKANVLESYTTNYADPGNDPIPFDPLIDTLCCGGAGPAIGAMIDLGDGLESKAIACVEEPWQGVLLENGMTMPCANMAYPPSGDPGPISASDGSEFVREIPIDNMPPEINMDWTVTDPDGVLADYRVEVNLRGVTVSGQVIDNSAGLTVPTITVVKKTDGANTLTSIPIVNVEAAGPTITSIDIFDRDGVPLPDIGERLRQRLIINTTNFTTGPPFPRPLTTELAVSGTVASVERKLLTADNVMQVDVITPNQDPPYGNTLTVEIQDPAALFSDTEVMPVTELPPAIRGAWVTGGPANPGAPPPFWVQPGNVVTVTLKGDRFDPGAVVIVDAPDLAAGPFTVVDDTEITFDITIGSALGFPIKMKVENPSGLQSNGGVSQTLFIVGDLGPFVGTIIETEIDGVSTAPVEGQDVKVRLFYTVLPENPTMFVEAYMGATPVPYDDMWGFEYFPDHVEFMLRVPFGLGALPIDVSVTKNQIDPTQIAAGSTAAVLFEPVPVGVPAPMDLSPGATGVGSLTGAGDVFYGQDIEVFAPLGEKIVITSPVVATPFTGLTFNYAVSEDAVPGADTFSLSVTNRSGTNGITPLGTATYPPITVTALEYVGRPLIEGRVDTLAKIIGTNFRAGATVAVTVGTVTVHDVVFVSSTELQVQLDAPQLTGGDPFTLEVTNPIPDPSSDTVGGAVLDEPIPLIDLILKPPTTGGARVIELVGQNLYVPDTNTPGPMTPTFDKFNLTSWDVQSNGFWRGVGDTVGGANELVTIDLLTPGGNSYPTITSFRISAVSVTPLPTGIVPTAMEGYVALDFTISGTDFDSVAVVQAVTSDLVPIGGSTTLPMVISSMTSEWIVGTIYLDGGLIDVDFDIEFLDSTLALLGTLSPGFSGAQGLAQPYIVNKAVPYPDETTALATVTHLLELDPSVPILDPAAWSITNGTLLSAVDTSGFGTGWTLQWENGPPGEFEIRLVNTGIAPPRFDVLRRTLV
jgi:hypothetical protein